MAGEKAMIVSLSELAGVAGMPSEPTIRKMIEAHVDFPVVSRGKNGVAYEFELGAAVGFIQRLRQREEEAARARAAEVAQASLDLLGGETLMPASLGAGELTPQDRKAALEAEVTALKLARERGQLISKAGAEAAVATLLTAIGTRLGTFTARLSRRQDVPREIIAAIDALLEDDLSAIAADLEQGFAGVSADRADGDGPADAGAPGAPVASEGADNRQ